MPPVSSIHNCIKASAMFFMAMSKFSKVNDNFALFIVKTNLDQGSKGSDDNCWRRDRRWMLSSVEGKKTRELQSRHEEDMVGDGGSGGGWLTMMADCGKWWWLFCYLRCRCALLNLFIYFFNAWYWKLLDESSESNSGYFKDHILMAAHAFWCRTHPKLIPNYQHNEVLILWKKKVKLILPKLIPNYHPILSALLTWGETNATPT